MKPVDAYSSLGILAFRNRTSSACICKQELPCSLFINLCSLQIFETLLVTINEQPIKLNWFGNMPIFSYSLTLEMNFRTTKHLSATLKINNAKLRKEPHCQLVT